MKKTQVCSIIAFCRKTKKIDGRNLKSEKSQDYSQKPQRNFTFMNSISVHKTVHCRIPVYCSGQLILEKNLVREFQSYSLLKQKLNQFSQRLQRNGKDLFSVVVTHTRSSFPKFVFLHFSDN